MTGKGEAKPVNMDTLLDEVISGLSHIAAANNVVLRRVGTTGLFPSLWTWEVPLRLAIMNLITNAVQMVALLRTTGGLVQCEVVEETDASGQRFASVLISDNGPGIHSYLWGRVFMPMYTTRKEGLGMGLFLSREACRSIGVSLELRESVLLSGTTFCLSIPDATETKENCLATAHRR